MGGKHLSRDVRNTRPVGWRARRRATCAPGDRIQGAVHGHRPRSARARRDRVPRVGEPRLIGAAARGRDLAFLLGRRRRRQRPPPPGGSRGGGLSRAEGRAPGRLRHRQPLPSAGVVVVVYPSDLFAFSADSFVKVSPSFTESSAWPISFSVARTTFGPPAGMRPSGRNWPLSWVRAAT